MRQFNSLFPALLFSGAALLYISNTDTGTYRNIQTAEVQSKGESINGKVEWELQRLHDPETGKIPANVRGLELEFAATLPGYQAHAGKNSNNIMALNWQSRGPQNVGGRTRAFAMDFTNESKILAGSTSGGMWTSTNGGTSWAKSWGIPHQSITCISQDKRAGKTNTWYIGTGEGYGQSAGASGAYYLGNGMYKSTDGGQTWNSLTSTSSNTPQSFDNVWDLVWNTATNPAEPANDVVYAATYGAIMKSTNGGTSWTIAKGSSSASPFSYFTDVAVTPTGVIYATLSSDGTQKGIYRSPDGNTWTAITPAGFPTTYGRTVIGVSPSDENQVYFLACATTGFGKSDTNYSNTIEWNSLWKFHYDVSGGKWFNLSANLPTSGTGFDAFNVQGGYDAVVRVHPTDTAMVFIGGNNLYRSTTGFFTNNNSTHIGGYKVANTNTTWAAQAYRYPNHHPDQHEIAFLPSNPSIMYSINDGGIYKTTNNAASTVAWTDMSSTYMTSMFYSVALDHASPNDSTIIGGSQDNGTWFINSKNPSTPWVQPHGGDGSHCAIANNKSSYYFSVQQGEIMKASLDASGNILNFASIDPIGGKGYLFINPLTLDQNNNNIMYLAGGKYLWRNDALNSIPLSGNWDSISTGWTQFPDSLPIPWVTVNGVKTGAKISALAVSKNPANVLYYGTSLQKVYRVDNANTGTPTALDITGTGANAFPTGAYVSCVAVDPTDAGKVMVSFSNYGVYSIFYSTNADSTAPTWTKVAGNLEQNASGTGNGPSVRWLSILPVSDGVVYLAATSTGLYATSSLNGTSTLWSQQGAATIGNAICDMIDYRTSDGLVVVGTHSSGIYTTNITSINDVLTTTDAQSTNFRLSNSPNPFSNGTTISFSLKKNQKVLLSLYDLHGKLIQVIEDKEFPAGEHRVNFSGTNVSTGVYYYSLRAGELSETKKMIVIK